MPVPRNRQPEPIEAKPQEREDIERLLARLDDTALTPQLTTPDEAPIVLPQSLFDAFRLSARILAKGDMVSIVPVHKLLTTQEAANLLNVSREYVRQLIRDKKLPSIDVGRHHRVSFSDLMTFRATRDAARRHAIDEITSIGVDAGDYFV